MARDDRCEAHEPNSTASTAKTNIRIVALFIEKNILWCKHNIFFAKTHFVAKKNVLEV